MILALSGTYVDPRITPGFQYRVRQLGSGKYLFKGRAMTLQSIGMGYGKRITFKVSYNEKSCILLNFDPLYVLKDLRSRKG